jgi:hypothetical protein
MTSTDWIGFAGVTILLVAYFLNLRGTIKKESVTYLLLNLAGAGIACFASVLLKYLPFVIMEGCWTAVSAVGLLHYFYHGAKKNTKQMVKNNL